MKMKIDGNIIEVKKFSTRIAAENYKNRKKKREIVYYRAHEYYVSK